MSAATVTTGRRGSARIAGTSRTPPPAYDLVNDPAQKTNRYATEPAKVKELAALLERYMSEGRSTPGPKQKNDVDVIWDKRGK